MDKKVKAIILCCVAIVVLILATMLVHDWLTITATVVP